MRFSDILNLFITEPYFLVLFIWTGQGWFYLALFLCAILCLAFAVKKGSVGLMAATYAVEVLPFVFSVWHFYTSDDLAAILTGMASVIYLIIIAITVIVHLSCRQRFKKVPAKETDWPIAQE